MSEQQQTKVLGKVDLNSSEHAHTLDIRSPAKWQMRIRLHLGSLNGAEAETWLEELRLITRVAGMATRDQVYRRVTSRCYVCDKPFVNGRPEGEAFYYDREKQCIKVYCHTQSEYPQLLQMCQKKEDEKLAAEEREDRAARQAAKDARSAVRAEK